MTGKPFFLVEMAPGAHRRMHSLHCMQLARSISGLPEAGQTDNRQFSWPARSSFPGREVLHREQMVACAMFNGDEIALRWSRFSPVRSFRFFSACGGDGGTTSPTDLRAEKHQEGQRADITYKTAARFHIALLGFG